MSVPSDSSIESRPLELCVVGPGLKFLSGLSVYTNRLAGALSQHHFVSVLLLRDLVPARLYPGGQRVGQPLTSLTYEGQRTLDGIDWFWGRSLLSAFRFLRVRPPDVLILQWWTAAAAHTYLALALFARRRRIAVVIEFHEVQDTGEAKIPGLSSYSKWMLRLLTRLAGGAIVHHDHDLDQLRKVVNIDNLVTEQATHPGYDHLLGVLPQTPVELEQQSLQSGFGASGNRETVFLFFGLIRPYKGLEDFVAAIDLLDEQTALASRFLIVGETWEQSVGGVIAARLSKYKDRIHIVNRYVSDAEAAAVFELADALVLPYKRSSSSGPMAIAMSHRLRIIYYDLPGLAAGAAGYANCSPVPPDDVQALSDAMVKTVASEGFLASSDGGGSSWEDTAASFDRLFVRVVAQ